MTLKLTKAALKEAITTLYAHLCEGKSDTDVMAAMGLSAEDYEAIKVAMFDAKAEELKAKPHEHVYVDYVIKQSENLKDLSKMVGEFYVSKQYNAMVGAIRARSEIYDKLLKTGQEFGVIKTPKSDSDVVAGFLVANLSNKDLKDAIVNELKELNKMMKAVGDKSIVDMEPGSLHYGPTVEDDEASLDAVAPPPRAPTTAKALPPARPAPFKTAKADTAKVSGGRIVVKERPRIKAVMP